MDISVIISILVGFGLLIGGYILEGGVFGHLFEYTAAMIVFGGTIGAVMLSFPVATLKRFPKIMKVLINPPKIDLVEVLEFFKDISYKTRKNGLLFLEGEISQIEDLDPMIRKGLQMAVDGFEPEIIKSTLELEIEVISERHNQGAAMFEAAGGYGPTMGIIGTVLGLVHVLGNLDDPSTLGPKIAVAFIATLYGVAFANLVYLPIASRLRAIDAVEVMKNEMIIEGILAVQEGKNPAIIVNKLSSYLNKGDLEKISTSERTVDEV
ncbi:MAG: flagellar motor protein [Clostridiaceae bacterium]